MSKVIGSIVAVLLVVISFSLVLMSGGESEQVIPGKNGSEYSVLLDLPTGILELIEECKLKEVDQTCNVAVTVKVKLLKKPSGPGTLPEKETEVEEIDVEGKKETPDKSGEEKEVPDTNTVLETSGDIIIPSKAGA